MRDVTVFGRIPGATALLLGTSSYASLPDVPAVATTVSDLAAALVRRSGLSPEAVHVATELSGPEEMGDAIAAVTESARGPILVSFSGHGLVSPSGSLYLATARTDARRSRMEHTALPYSTLRRYLLDSAARPVVVLLDCCFSGWALSAMGPADDVAGLTEIDGAFVVTAAGRSEMALAPEGARHTAFGGALLRLLEHGDPRAPAELTLQAVHRHLSTALPAAGYPRPRCRASGTAGELVLAPNPARAAAAPSASRTSAMVLHQGPPYQGLAPFGTQDGALFFGRDRLVTDLLRRLAGRLDDPRPLVVTGASGSGKSSLLRAGLLPAVARGALELYGSATWPTALITPTASPLAALDRVEGSRLIVIDQFEELFTECDEEETRREFVARLHELAGSALVVVSVRADFYGRCAAYPQLAVAMGDGQLVLGPMSADELREAIVRPAELAGLGVEPGLVELLLADLGGRSPAGYEGYEAGRLPLLSHALLSTWQRRTGDVLTVEAYRATGGIHGALAATADAALDRVGDARAARSLMRTLVHVGDGTEDTRRRVERAHLPPDVSGHVVEVFAAERLVTVDEEHIQLTHEALLHAWPTLRAWIDEDRAGALVEQHLLEAALAWERDHRDPSALYRGARLALAAEWASDTTGAPVLEGPASGQGRSLGPLAAEFLEASQFQENATARATRRRVRLLRNLAASLAALLVVTLAATALAIRQTATATEQRDLAAARKTAALADTLRASDPRTAMLLSVAAWRLARVDEARAALYSSLAQREQDVFPAPQASGAARFALNADGSATVAVDQGRARLWDVASGALLTEVTGVDPAPESVALSPDGRLLAVAGQSSVRLWNLTTGRPQGPAFGSASYDLAFSGSGRRLSTRTLDDRAQVWDVGDLTTPVLERHDADIVGISLSGDDRLVALLRRNGDVELRDPDLRELVRAGASAAALSPDGRWLAVSQGSTVRFWNVAAGGWSQVRLPSVPGRWIGYSSDGRWVMTLGVSDPTSDAPRAALLSIGTAGGRELLRRRVADVPGQEYARLDPAGARLSYPLSRGAVAVLDLSTLTSARGEQVDPALAAAFGGGGAVLAVTTGKDVRVGPPGEPGSPLGITQAAAIALSADGSTLAVAEPGAITLWETRTSTRTGTLPVPAATALAFGSGDRLAVSVYTGEPEPVQIWDVTTRARLPLATGAGGAAMAFLPADRALAIGGVDNSLSPLDGQAVRRRPFGGQALAVAASPDGTTIATSDRNGRVDLWDARTLAWRGLLAASDGGDGALSRLAFSPDGSLLASGSHGGDVRLWRVSSRTPLGLPRPSHAQTVIALAFGAGGSDLLSIAADGGLQRHPVDADRAATAVCARAGRDLSGSEWRRLVPETPPRKVCSP